VVSVQQKNQQTSNQTANSQKPTTNSQKPEANSKKPTANSKKPAANSQKQPATWSLFKQRIQQASPRFFPGIVATG